MVLNQQKKVRVAIAPLDKFLKRVKSETRVGNAELTVCLVSDAQIARMNRKFRKKRGPTDVLSFPVDPGLRPTAASGRKLLGDIAIAPGVARRYAVKNGRALRDELKVLILHGVLHLQGYDHETDRGEMNRIEKKLRRRLGLS